MKKIGILTQPLHNNYGGLLQAFALQKYLRKLGHDAITIDFQFPKPSLKMVLRGLLSNLYRKIIKKEDVKYYLPISEQELVKIGVHTNQFRQNYITTTHRLTSQEQFHELEKYNFDAFVVGSDQVWRPIYSPDITAFFFKFIKNNDSVKKFSYAASFGTDNCSEYTAEQIVEISKLAKKFDAISVREDSGVKLCKENFGIDAKHVIDPTLLLDKTDYEQLVTQALLPDSDGTLMSYVLDKNPSKQAVIQSIAEELGLKPFTVMQEENGVYPEVERWIKGFIDAQYVVTDSFHGVVFSIIFNKPFIAIGNVSRGLARFESLLKMFDLEERIISDVDQLSSELVNQKIDYTKVNTLKVILQREAKSFIVDALN